MVERFDYTDKTFVMGWNNISTDEQNKYISNRFSSVKGGHWFYTQSVASMLKYSTYEQCINILSVFVNNSVNRDLHRDLYLNDMISALKNKNNTEDFKKIIAKSKNERCHKLLLGLNNLSTSEEVLGLRGLSKYSKCPTFVYANNYYPTYEALRRLPSITRLNALEALCSDRQIGHDVFDGIKEEEMNHLLFGSVLRHRERVEKVWEDFLYFKRMGSTSKLDIKYECGICGPYSINMISNKVHEMRDFEYVGNAKCLTWKTCMFCGMKDIKVDLKRIEENVQQA